MEQGCSSFCGMVTAWTVPRRDREGFTSVLSLLCDDTGFMFSLSVTLQSLEDHAWYNGQRVVARDVTFDSLLQGRTHECVPMEEKMDFFRNVFFMDLPVDKITGLKREEGGALLFRMESSMFVFCSDKDKINELLNIGIGSLVQLFNVKVSSSDALFVTASSGVKKIVAPPPAPPIVVSAKLKEPEGVKKFILTGFVRRWSWNCYVCRAENSRYMDKCANCKRRKEVRFARMWLRGRKKFNVL
jgi:hypothetical protein